MAAKYAAETPVDQFQVADILITEGFTWEVVKIRKSKELATFHCRWTKKGAEPPQDHKAFTFRRNANKMRLTQHQTPCRDSDCDCIHDQVKDVPRFATINTTMSPGLYFDGVNWITLAQGQYRLLISND